MRALILTLALGVTGAALFPSNPAEAWWDHWHRWHGYRGPVVVVAPPPPVVYAPVYPHHVHWVPPHYDYYGRFIRGHWA